MMDTCIFQKIGGLIRRPSLHLLAGQYFFESKNLTVNPFKTGFERRIEALFLTPFAPPGATTAIHVVVWGVFHVSMPRGDAAS
jgi:hypothetical protein